VSDVDTMIDYLKSQPITNTAKVEETVSQ